MTLSLPLRRLNTLLLILALAAALSAGCGGDGEGGSSETASTPGGAAGALTHVDGTVELATQNLTVTPDNGDDTVTLAIGPAVQRGAVQALAAAGTKARVYYHAGDESPTAAKVEAAPSAQDGTQTYDGQIEKVSAGSITIAGDDGSRTFEIRAADQSAFDIEHLEEHRAESEPVRVYYSSDTAGEFAVAYEDA